MVIPANCRFALAMAWSMVRCGLFCGRDFPVLSGRSQLAHRRGTVSPILCCAGWHFGLALTIILKAQGSVVGVPRPAALVALRPQGMEQTAAMDPGRGWRAAAALVCWGCLQLSPLARGVLVVVICYRRRGNVEPAGRMAWS